MSILGFGNSFFCDLANYLCNGFYGFFKYLFDMVMLNEIILLELRTDTCQNHFVIMRVLVLTIFL